MAQVIKSAGFGSASGSAEKTSPASAPDGAAQLSPDDPRPGMLRQELVWLVRVQRELANAARVLDDMQRYIEIESADGRPSVLAAHMERACPSYRDPFAEHSALELLTELGLIVQRHTDQLAEVWAAREGE